MTDSDTERGTTNRTARRGMFAPVLAGIIVLLVMAACDAFIFTQRTRYESEIARLRASMTHVERNRADALMASERRKLLVAVELVRRQARIEPALHLSVALDSGAMFLEREGALLRTMPVQIGPERRVGIAPDTVPLAAPRGVRTVAAVLTDSTAWEVPAWVYADRGLAIPPDAERRFRGSLGTAALVLDGGTIIYSMPTAGPLSDSSYVMPGAVRARSDDLRAILPNVHAGVRVYFY